MSVRTIVKVHPSLCPSPPKLMSACSAEKSGQSLQPGLVHSRASFNPMSWTSPVFVYTMTLPFTFTRAMSPKSMPSSSWTLCCINPSYVNVFDQSRPNVHAMRLRHLFTRRASRTPVTLA